MEKPLILVTMGTNDYPFNRLYNFIAADPLFASHEVEWFIQCGSCVVERPPANGTVTALVSRKQMDDLIQRAALVVSHCGIGSLNQMLQYRKRTIFVPRVQRFSEFSDDHQLQIAGEIRNRLITVVFPDDDFPTLNLSQLVADAAVPCESADIINYDVAEIVRRKLAG
jgi:UDP-N-acetylglucosamine transferase subunit ALG13